MTPFGTLTKISSLGEFSLIFGLDSAMAKKLVAYSHDVTDELMSTYTPRDKERFCDAETVKRWYNEGRYIFCLLDKDNDLAGIFWQRPAEMPHISMISDMSLYNELISHKNMLHTNGIRIYPKYRGKGLAKILESESQKYYKTLFSTGYIVTDVEEQNIPSQKIFSGNGYTMVGKGENKKFTNSGNIRFIYVKKIEA